MKFDKIPKLSYYKFKVSNIETDEIKLFSRYKELKDYVSIPRSTLYKLMNGEKLKKWKNYEFKQIRLPKYDLREI